MISIYVYRHVLKFTFYISSYLKFYKMPTEKRHLKRENTKYLAPAR